MSKTAEEMANEINDKFTSLKQELEAAKENSATPEQLKEAQDALEAFKAESEESLKQYVTLEEVSKMKQDLIDAQEEISALKEGGKQEIPESFGKAVHDSLKENHEKLKEFLKEDKNGRGNFSMVVKVPALVTTQNVTPTAAGDAYAAQTQASVSPYPRFSYFIEQALDVGSTNLATIPYVDELPGEGDAEIVAEGALKPLIDVDYVTAYSVPKKAAGVMKATMEALADFNWLQSAMTSTLRKKHDIARQNEILYGATGIDNLATAFNAAILGGITVADPQEYDVIAALSAGIVNSSEGNYIPNAILVNTLDNLKKRLNKDANNNYIMPPFSDAEGNVVDGVRVISHPFVTAGRFIIGDMTNIKLRNMMDYEVSFGWENDDFRRNQITMLGESRFHLYITENDKRGIISGTFADVVTALT